MINLRMFIKSIYSPTSINKARYLPIGKAIMHIFLLTLIFNLSIHFHTALNISGLLSLVDDNKGKLTEAIIIDGELNENALEDTYVSKNNFAMIISNNEAMDLQIDNTIAFFKREIYVKTESQDVVIPYTMIGDGPLYELIQANKGMMYLGATLFFVGSYLFQLTILFIGVSLLAGISMLTNQTNKVSYRNMWRISAFAITTTVLLFTLVNFLEITLPPLLALLILLVSNFMVIFSFRK